jgi:hypothetical protein
MQSLTKSRVYEQVRSVLIPRMQQLYISIAGRWFLDGMRVDIAMRLQCWCVDNTTCLEKLHLKYRKCWYYGKRARSKRRECYYLC